MAQILTSKNASKDFDTSKNTSLFNIKGGPLPPHQNDPATDTHLIGGSRTETANPSQKEFSHRPYGYGSNKLSSIRSNDYSAYKVIRLPDKSIIETKHAYFDKSVFPLMGALNPSVDHAPHSGLPDFDSTALFPFQEEESISTQEEEPL
ncbi:hypothetical protein PCASD_14146 [Puccinia coronata f. sp. avenae]|uniref:Uncharacterized protein n=1 Tax=Puccinia coronata f. sp. avenae TaxID=200324 RepID=A0A2N5UFY6_9BASI|nr:hypothetical protein PCASD_14146 [Puccinia coronata f. sp. avenae]